MDEAAAGDEQILLPALLSCFSCCHSEFPIDFSAPFLIYTLSPIPPFFDVQPAIMHPHFLPYSLVVLASLLNSIIDSLDEILDVVGSF